MPRWPEPSPNRDNMIVSLHLQGYLHAEIGRLFGLSRERVRQIVDASGLRLDDRTFRSIRLRRRFPEELVECACGCGGKFPKYIYNDVGNSAYERRWLRGHYQRVNPSYRRDPVTIRNYSEARRRSWAEGKYEDRKPSAREVANRGKIMLFIGGHPGCSLTDLHRGTGIPRRSVKIHTDKLRSEGLCRAERSSGQGRPYRVWLSGKEGGDEGK